MNKKSVIFLEWWMALFLIFFVSIVVNGNTVVLTEQNTEKEVLDLLFYADSKGNLTIEDILSGNKKDEFQPYRPNGISITREVGAYWIFVEIQNGTPVDGRWVLDFENWSYVDLYQKNEAGVWEIFRTGHLTPYFNRNYKFANQSYILTELKAGETRQYWVRLRPDFNYELVPNGLSFVMLPQKVQMERDSWHRIIISMFLGIIGVMFFYNFFIFFSTRQKAYALYLGLLFVMFLVTASNAGLLILLFKNSETFPAWKIQLNYLFPHLLAIMPVLFLREFLRVPERYPFWNKVILGLIIAVAANYFLMHLKFEAGFNGAALLGLITVVVIMSIVIKSMWDRYPGSSFLFLGYFIFYGFVIYTMFTFLGVLPSNAFAHDYAMAFGTTIESVIFSLALANQINSLKKENEAKQLQLIENLKEKEQMQTQMNKELERKVQERTKEIQLQKEKIEDQKQAIEIEMKKNEELLLNILPESTARELKINGLATPKSYENVTILFSDFQNFSKIAENMSPEELVSNLDQYFRAFDNIISKFPIEKIKTIGDAYLCAGGLPEKNTTNAYDIAEAALMMIEAVEKINQEKVKNACQPWNIRIGINSGPVTAGVVGKSKFAYDLWGDTVNIASRMETNSEPGKVNVSESTYELIKDRFIFTSRGSIPVKHKGPLKMYFLEEIIKDPNQFTNNDG